MVATLGIAADRELPTFTRESLVDWFDDRGPRVSEREAEEKVVLFADPYTNYSYPEPGKAAVEVLEAAGVHVRVPGNLAASGRAAFSMGFLEKARGRARSNVEALAPMVEDGWSVVFVEPSDAVMFQDEYLDLLEGRRPEAVAAAAYGVMEYLDRARLDEAVDWSAPGETLSYHGHCNQKATNRDHHAVGVLRRAGYEVDPLDSTCCGMAGSFGYEAEHYELSKAIGRLLFDKVADSPGETVVAPGGSCRSQLGDRDGHDRPPHPVEKLAEAVA
jgi:Fe-S oxidoreductase